VAAGGDFVKSNAQMTFDAQVEAATRLLNMNPFANIEACGPDTLPYCLEDCNTVTEYTMLMVKAAHACGVVNPVNPDNWHMPSGPSCKMNCAFASLYFTETCAQFVAAVNMRGPPHLAEIASSSVLVGVHAVHDMAIWLQGECWITMQQLQEVDADSKTDSQGQSAEIESRGEPVKDSCLNGLLRGKRASCALNANATGAGRRRLQNQGPASQGEYVLMLIPSLNGRGDFSKVRGHKHDFNDGESKLDLQAGPSSKVDCLANLRLDENATSNPDVCGMQGDIRENSCPNLAHNGVCDEIGRCSAGTDCSDCGTDSFPTAGFCTPPEIQPAAPSEAQQSGHRRLQFADLSTVFNVVKSYLVSLYNGELDHQDSPHLRGQTAISPAMTYGTKVSDAGRRGLQAPAPQSQGEVVKLFAVTPIHVDATGRVDDKRVVLHSGSG
jgi:hypothetical protein